ncbi:hypothetical protein PG985_008920 [Apiospora marii]|uniref:Uncharacterized protein n=1 Tax=Apiospora marii TaxID=335849 RepID=A0ABR1RB82_9PEZI
MIRCNDRLDADSDAEARLKPHYTDKESQESAPRGLESLLSPYHAQIAQGITYHEQCALAKRVDALEKKNSFQSYQIATLVSAITLYGIPYEMPTMSNMQRELSQKNPKKPQGLMRPPRTKQRTTVRHRPCWVSRSNQ